MLDRGSSITSDPLFCQIAGAPANTPPPSSSIGLPPGVDIQVATASRGRAVVLEAVDLNDEPVADQKVDGVPIDPHLLTNADTEVADSSEEDRLEARVAQL